MPQPLTVHPLTPCAADLILRVGAARPQAGRLAVTYALFGPIEQLYLPGLGEIARADDLWLRTCFEAFVRPEGEEGYIELNFGPSGAWAAYRFSGYRVGMTLVGEIAPPRIDVLATGALYELRAAIDLGAHLPVGAAWRLGLSAVIEETSGVKSYWALAHPPEKPDFHHSRAFVLDLPSPEST
ncbi:MAG: DOMON-like domain-containing protein [Caulobacteraceae bacterium]